MGAYQTVAVGTDGSDSSLRAVDRAATIAGSAGATLLIISAYQAKEGGDAELVGSQNAEQTLERAQSRAQVVADVTVDTLAVEGDPVDAIIGVVGDRKADLVVIGNRGLNSLAGRLLGSVPQGISRKAAGDVLIVHTT